MWQIFPHETFCAKINGYFIRHEFQKSVCKLENVSMLTSRPSHSRRTPAASAERLRGAASPRLRLSSPWQQQRRPGGEGGVPADGRGRGLLRPGLPERLRPLLAARHPGPRGAPRPGGFLRASGGGVVPRLQPGRRLAPLQQLRLRS